MSAFPGISTEVGSKHASFRGARVLVVGLGRFGGGVGVTRWLVEQGAAVVVTDQAEASSLSSSVRELEGLPVEFKLGGHDPGDLRGIDLVIVNPAVDKSRSEFFRAIVDAGVPWTTEMNLFCERCPAPVLGITGSFGKSTTAAMVAAVLETATGESWTSFRRVFLGGNIGRSLLGDLKEMDDRDVVVLEMSNAQLEDLPRIAWVPSVAVITNLHPHHLDRHGSLANYIEAKFNILAPHDRCAFRRMRWPAAAATGGAIIDHALQPVIVADLHEVAEAELARRTSQTVHRVLRIDRDNDSVFDLRVPGAHNQANAHVARAVAEVLSLPDSIVRSALANFRGLPHRLEFVGTLDGVDYFNDSKSTSPSATVVALEALSDRSIVAIVGGKRKEGVAYEDCVRSLGQRCRAVVSMGECGVDFAAALRSHRSDGACVVHQTATLDEALERARMLAQSGDAVLFSPGAPSFDAYVNFTERGDHFKRLVAARTGSTAS